MDRQIIRNVSAANVYYNLIRVGEDDFKSECSFLKDSIGEGLRRLGILPALTGISTIRSIEMLMCLDRREGVSVASDKEAEHVELLAELLGIEVRRIPREGYNMAVR